MRPQRDQRVYVQGAIARSRRWHRRRVETKAEAHRDGGGVADEANVSRWRRVGDFASRDDGGIIDASRLRQRRVANVSKWRRAGDSAFRDGGDIIDALR